MYYCVYTKIGKKTKQQPKIGGTPVDALLQNPLMLYIPLLAAFMYFMVYRPQKKQQQEKQALMEGMKKGDRVVTVGGMYGIVRGIKDTRVTLEIASEVFVSFDKSAVTSVLRSDAKAANMPDEEVNLKEDPDGDDEDYVIEQDSESN